LSLFYRDNPNLRLVKIIINHLETVIILFSRSKMIEGTYLTKCGHLRLSISFFHRAKAATNHVLPA